MARFLTTRGTTLAIENIINDATSGLVLISPFIKIPDSLFQNLKAADKRGIRTTLVYGKKKELEPSVEEQLRQLKNIKVCFLENLRAKCYFNEQSMVITSLNLLDFSEQNNREMGILITRQDDEAVFNDTIREAKMMISLATRSPLAVQVKDDPSEKGKPHPKTTREKPKSIWLRDISDIFSDIFGADYGYCISCRKRINFDEYRPYCPDCYKRLLKNKAQQADCCHECGRATKTTINKPLYRTCFEKP
jgi:hypothetical protein